MNLLRNLLPAVLASVIPALAGPVIYMGSNTQLFRIDPATGSVLSSSFFSGTSGFLSGLALSPDASTLYGTFTNCFFGCITSLGTIDTATGAFSSRGTNSFGPAAIGFDASGQLYGIGGAPGTIMQIDVSTGAIGAQFACGVTGWGLTFSGGNAITLSGQSLFQTPQGSTCEGGTGGGGGGTAGSNGSITVGSSGSGGSSTVGSGSGTPYVGLYRVASAGGTFYAMGFSNGVDGLYSFTGVDATPVVTYIANTPSGASYITAADETAFAPEPTAVWLMGLGFTGMVVWRRYSR